MFKAQYTNIRGRLSMVDLLIRLARFVKKLYNIFNIKKSWSKLVSTRRSTVLSLRSDFLGSGFAAKYYTRVVTKTQIAENT